MSYLAIGGFLVKKEEQKNMSDMDSWASQFDPD